MVVLVSAGAAFLYQFAAIFAALRHSRRSAHAARRLPGISILKPVCGLDSGFEEAIRSHAAQNYPEFEILFGVADLEDPAVPAIRRLAADYPSVRIRLMHSAREAPNRKVALLEALSGEAAYPVVLVNDSDIQAPDDYLRRIVGSLEDPGVGLVTCLYRGWSENWPGRFEALGIATDFVPSVLVAPLAGVNEFALGSTLLLRRARLDEIGGFASLADYLADDYQLGKRIRAAGYRIELSGVVVSTRLSDTTWSGVWRHQLRWRRTIRVSKGLGYLGIPVTLATLWSAVAAALGFWPIGLALLGVRLAAGWLTGVGILRCPITARYFWLIPCWDLWAGALWLAGLAGRTVEWRGRRLRLSPDGRIVDAVSGGPAGSAA